MLRWTQIGFGRTSSTRMYEVTERNLMGFKDGTNNFSAATTPGRCAGHVWVGDDEPPSAGCTGARTWSSAASACCIEAWDRDTLVDQEHR